MAVTQCILDRVRGADFDAESGNTYRATWNIKTDTSMGPNLVLAGSRLSSHTDPLPNMWSAYNLRGEIDPLSFFQTVSLRQNSSTTDRWTADGIYKPMPAGQPPGQNLENPLSRPALYWIEFEGESEEVTEGINLIGLGRTPEENDKYDFLRSAGTSGPIVNAVGDAVFDQVFQVRKRIVVCKSKNYESLIPIINIHLRFDNTLNADSFYGAGQGRARFDSIDTSEPQEERGHVFWTAVQRVSVSKTPFWKHVPNVGYNHIFRGFAEHRLIRARDDDGQPTGSPVRLDLQGFRITDQTQPGVTIPYRTRDLVSYADLI